jgi:hypothetical protein
MADGSFARTLALLLLLWASMTPQPASTQEAQPIRALAGRWAGEGIMTPSSGPVEAFKCVVTYFPSEDGARVKQNLRCKSANFEFDGSTHLQIASGKVTGRWQDNVYLLDGTVNGAVTPEGFSISLSGKFFDAKMTVVSSECQQSVTIVPEPGGPLKRLAAILKKC